jgi:RNA polymerase sigma-70 factor (ECF subfamily)
MPVMRGNQTQPAIVAPVTEDAALAETFEDFFEAEHERLLGALYLVTGNRHEAEELMQDAFLKVWERWDRVQTLKSPTGYLFRTALNAFRMRYRHALVAARRVVRAGQRIDPFDEVELREDVRNALARLTPRQRAAVVLTDLLGFSGSDAATTLGVKASTIRALSTQARDTLRSTMGSLDE